MMRAALLATVLIAASALAQEPAPMALDPARLAAGRALADKTVPAGAYAKVMAGTLPDMTSGITQQMLDMPVRQLAGVAGLSKEELAKLKGATTRQIMAIMDPAYEQRMQISMKTMFAVMGEIMAKVEPDMREGMAEAYASHFTLAQLNDINGFFSTPSGAAFASQQMTLMNDPAVRSRMQKMLPLFLQQLPEIAKRVQAATANLPKAKTVTTLTDADRAKLAALLGVPVEKLQAKGAK